MIQKLKKILDSATQVALYLWDTKNEKWEKPEVEGTLFVYSRSVSPKYGFTIMNRLSIENLNEEITPEINVHINTPFLLYQSKKNPARPRGIWFFSQYDCSRISSLVQSLQKEVQSEPVSELVPKTSVRAQPVRPSQNCHMDNVIQRTPTEERKSVDILGMFQSATDKFNRQQSIGSPGLTNQISGLSIMSANQTQANMSTNQMPLTPGKKVSLDALFQSAGATPKSSAIDHSTPIHHAGQPANGINHQTANNEHMNIEKTKNLKNMFGLSENNPPWESTVENKMNPPLYSSSSSDEIKFKPNSLPETIALELSKSKSRNHDSDHSETQKDSFAIIDDLSGSCSENGARQSPLARPNDPLSRRHLSRNLFGESKNAKPTLLSPAAFTPTTVTSNASSASNPLVTNSQYSAPPGFSQVTPTGNSHQAPEVVIHKDELKSTLISLIETDQEFLDRIYMAYVKRVKTKLHMPVV